MGYHIEKYRTSADSSDGTSSTGTSENSDASTTYLTHTYGRLTVEELYPRAEVERDLEVMLHYGFEPLEYPGQEYGRWDWLNRGWVCLTTWALFIAIPAAWMISSIFACCMKTLEFESFSINPRFLFITFSVSLILSWANRINRQSKREWDIFCQKNAEMWDEINRLLDRDLELAVKQNCYANSFLTTAEDGIFIKAEPDDDYEQDSLRKHVLRKTTKAKVKRKRERWSVESWKGSTVS